MQTTRCFVNFRVEFAASVEHAHDHFQRWLILEFRVRIDGNAAAIVGDGHKTAGLHLDFNPVGMAGQRLIHRVVNDLGKQVVQRFFIGAADVHPGTSAYRLQALKHLDVLCCVTGFRTWPASRRLWPCAGCPGGPFRWLPRGRLGPWHVKEVGLFRGLFLGCCFGHWTFRYTAANQLPDTMPRWLFARDLPAMAFSTMRKVRCPTG